MRSLDKHTTRDKRLLRLDREYDQLLQALRNAPVVPLATPFQRGWTKTYALRDDIRRRTDVETFRVVLAAINQRVWSRERDFVLADGREHRLRPRIIRPLEWKRLPWTAAHRRLFGFGAWEEEPTPHALYGRRRLIVGFSIYNPWWMVELVEPHMITHRRVELSDVRSRLAEIESYLEKHGGRERLDNLFGYPRRTWQHFEKHPSDLRADIAMSDELKDMAELFT